MPETPMKRAWSAKAAQKLDQDAAKAPVSRAERDMLQKFRTTPVLETHLTPMGAIKKEVVRDGEAKREARINFITKRLARQKSRARDGFNRSQ